jgi:hypothetical protein
MEFSFSFIILQTSRRRPPFGFPQAVAAKADEKFVKVHLILAGVKDAFVAEVHYFLTSLSSRKNTRLITTFPDENDRDSLRNFPHRFLMHVSVVM